MLVKTGRFVGIRLLINKTASISCQITDHLNEIWDFIASPWFYVRKNKEKKEQPGRKTPKIVAKPQGIPALIKIIYTANDSILSQMCDDMNTRARTCFLLKPNPTQGRVLALKKQM